MNNLSRTAVREFLGASVTSSFLGGVVWNAVLMVSDFHDLPPVLASSAFPVCTTIILKKNWKLRRLCCLFDIFSSFSAVLNASKKAELVLKKACKGFLTFKEGFVNVFSEKNRHFCNRLSKMGLFSVQNCYISSFFRHLHPLLSIFSLQRFFLLVLLENSSALDQQDHLMGIYEISSCSLVRTNFSTQISQFSRFWSLKKFHFESSCNFYPTNSAGFSNSNFTTYALLQEQSCLAWKRMRLLCFCNNIVLQTIFSKHSLLRKRIFQPRLFLKFSGFQRATSKFPE